MANRKSKDPHQLFRPNFVDDFVAAAKTAGSVFYTSRSTYYDGGSSSVYFATDCSAFVSWCWGVSRKTTYSIP